METPNIYPIRRIVRAILYCDCNNDLNFILGKNKKGYWGPIGGGIDECESKISALEREINEETSLDIIKIHKNSEFEIQYPTIKNGKPIIAHCFAYAVQVDPHQKIILPLDDNPISADRFNYEAVIPRLQTYKEQIQIFHGVLNKLY